MSTRVVTWPMPHTERRSSVYEMEAGETSIPVWLARVREAISEPEGAGWTNMLSGPTQWASFARFDAQYPVEVCVRVLRPFQRARLLPRAAGIETRVENDEIRFTLDAPRHLTLCLDERDEHPLHLSCREIEINAPTQSSADVIYFGPGEHWIHSLHVANGQTVYLDGGAILRATLPQGAIGKRSGVLNLTHYGEPVINVANAKNVRICGRGIIDGSCLPHPAKSLLSVSNSSNVRIEGIMLRNSPNWHLPIRESEDVTVENIACLSGRLNSDGINCVGSSRVAVRNCFVRNHDDSFVVKTTNALYAASGVLYENCVAWNDWGYAFGVSYETRAAISDVAFRNCEVLFARHWPLGIHVSDAGAVGPVRFERIGVEALQTSLEQTNAAIKVEIVKDIWGNDDARGHICDITFQDVHFYGEAASRIVIAGFDEEHRIEDVRFENMRAGERAVTAPDDPIFQINEFAQTPIVAD